ncbi:HBR299Cp [Eremothecium sinecaudum]|uniref:Signal recognition particle receptor subunit alpha homolog n=1 Tax=Eremothecium sinecaudum TaxID=45286 RepID=A0A120K1B3_9SACH|nr:HBR299Cp [Eremothecium sinecaudum]AMD19200.1 HBR299Cp [Eremothecium sinecaudum]
MIDQVAIFTPNGQVLFKYNAVGKRFAEKQFNKFIYQLISQSVMESDSKYPVITVDSHAFMFKETKQVRLFFVVSYASVQSIELVQEAEEVIGLTTKLWESLGLNDVISANCGSSGQLRQDRAWVLEGGEDKLLKFEQYFAAKYEDIKENGKNQPKKGAVASKKKQVVKKTASKQLAQKSRKWGANGMLDDSDTTDSTLLDFSPDLDEGQEESNDSLRGVTEESFGKRTASGDFLIKEIDDLLTANKGGNAQKTQKPNSAFAFIQKHWFGNKTITEEDLAAILEKLKKQLLEKNVAPVTVDYLASQVSKDLVGTKTANWTSVKDTAVQSLEKALTSILTPSVSVDLLREIQKTIQRKDPSEKKDPYVFSVVGVNGVGKSTNLSKLAFWLLQNRFKVLIVACDTFRSGAVEQLRVHVENLAQLTDEDHVRGSKNSRGKTGNDSIELFEAGYGGSDLVTRIGKQAIKYANENYFDVVLMDTAGRRHNDATLMSPLKSFAEQIKPNKIIMVGEALVGTDSVQQARNFNQAFGKERKLDFFIISKCDTVGDMLGTMVNMVYATGIPILFVGVGQTYTDLRTLSVSWAVNTLMS